MDRDCVSNLSMRLCSHLQGRTAGPKEALIKDQVGAICCWSNQRCTKGVKSKQHLSKKSSLKSIALAVQQHNDEMKWSKHRSEQMQPAMETSENSRKINDKTKTSEETVMKNSKEFSLKKQDFFKPAAEKSHFLKHKKIFKSYCFIFRAREVTSWNIKSFSGVNFSRNIRRAFFCESIGRFLLCNLKVLWCLHYKLFSYLCYIHVCLFFCFTRNLLCWYKDCTNVVRNKKFL